MIQSAALRIKTNGKYRIVGKIVIIPQNTIIPALSNHWALYREELWSNVYSRKLKTIGIDASSFDYAAQQGIGGMVIWCKDKEELITVKKSDILASRVYELPGGEHPQYRIPISKLTVYKNVHKGLTTAWTNNIIDLEPKTDWADVEDKQQELF